MISRVLLGYDGSAAADRAAEFAIDIASRFGAELHVLAVVRPPEFGTEVESEAIIEQGRRHCSQILKPLQSRFKGAPLTAKFEIAVGHPSEQLLLYEERHGIDHIVVGHRGKTALSRWLVGSVARQVIAHAACAVTVVRG